MKMKLPSGPFRTIFAGFLAVGLLAAAGDPPSGAVVARRGDVTITASDLHDALNRIDPAVRAQILGNSAAPVPSRPDRAHGSERRQQGGR
jgi:hypothetical protein